MLWLLPGLPLLAGLALVLAGRRAERVAGGVALAAAVIALALALWAAGARPQVQVGWLPGAPIALAFDGLSAGIGIGAGAVALAVMVYAIGDLGRGAARARVLGLLLILTGGMYLAVCAASLLVLFLAWEILALATLGLIGAPYGAPERMAPARRVWVLTRIGDLGLLAACAAAFAGVGSLAIADLPEALPEPWLGLAAGGIVVAAISKSAQLPLAAWTSFALGPRPHPAALLGTALLVVSGGYLLLRTADILAQTDWALPLVGVIGAASAILLGLVALAQRDLAQVIAASTGAQKGLILLAIGSGAAASGAGYIVAHGFFKALLVVSACALLLRLATTDLHRLGEGARRLPFMRLAFALGALTIAGLPPLSAFVLKEGILASALAVSPVLYAVGLAASLVTSLYALRMLALVWSPAPASAREDGAYLAPLEEEPQRPPPPANPATALAILALCAGSLAAALLGIGPLGRAWSALLGVQEAAAPAAWEIGLSVAVFFAALATVLALRRTGRLAPLDIPRVPRGAIAALHDWLGLRGLVDATARRALALARRMAGADSRFENAGLRALSRAALALAGRIARTDARVEESGLRGAGLLGVRLAQASARLDARGFEAGVARLAQTVGALGRHARAPQTGLVHQYYAQAVLGLGVIALVLIAASLP